MENWWKDLKGLLSFIGIIFAILFVVFIVNQFLLLYQFLSVLHPAVAVVVTAALVGLLLYVVWQLGRRLFRNQVVLELADDASEEEYQAYLDSLTVLLKGNPHLAELDFEKPEASQEEVIEEGFAILDEKSMPLIKENANAIFLTTAISQNGSLDSLVVLFSLVRMVGNLAGLYGTRPSLVSLMKLYAQVAGVVLMARTLEDADLIESQLEPLITSVLGESIASAIPGMVPVANLVVTSLMEGAVNAFLTLRVGIITQEYLASQQPATPNAVRRSASMRSVGYMGGIIKDNSKVIIQTVGNAAKKASVGTAKRWFGFDGKPKQN